MSAGSQATGSRSGSAIRTEGPRNAGSLRAARRQYSRRPTRIEEELAERLPGHMVPTVFFALTQFPVPTSGNTDRKRLREIGASFTAQHLAEMRTSRQGYKRQPSTEVERIIQRLWGSVLGIEPDSIGLDDSFFRLGGDSITAMQISSFYLSVSTGDIIKKKNIALLACDILPSTSTLSRCAFTDPVDNAFDLTVTVRESGDIISH
ncbi:hypothetical protein PTT_07004 [Pyrenophora teres f. teres 0-1]|uniref:Carrier domain-containing protein n=1 Tax=Pyrenophora teres f. teres (strain 0-1) TaxID=861557 RepID=E3RGQ9_PYRTT|nr:hypothetical protein PTT_07004 [Pyrenophora teres f. teres 0-1]